MTAPSPDPHALLYFSPPSLSTTGLDREADDAAAADCPVQFVSPSGRVALGVPLKPRRRRASTGDASADSMWRAGQLVVTSWDEPNELERTDRRRVAVKLALACVVNMLLATALFREEFEVCVCGGWGSGDCGPSP